MSIESHADAQTAASPASSARHAIAARLFLSAPSETDLVRKHLNPTDSVPALDRIDWLNSISDRVKANEWEKTLLPARLTVDLCAEKVEESVDGVDLDGLSELFPDLTFEIQSHENLDTDSNALIVSGTSLAIGEFADFLKNARTFPRTRDAVTYLAPHVTAVKYDEPRLQIALKDIQAWDWNAIAVFSAEWQHGPVEADVRLDKVRFESMAFYRGRTFTPKQTFDRDAFIQARGQDYQDKISRMSEIDRGRSR